MLKNGVAMKNGTSCIVLFDKLEFHLEGVELMLLSFLGQVTLCWVSYDGPNPIEGGVVIPLVTSYWESCDE